MPAQTARASAPQPPILLREKIGSIAVLTLNRPDARNSLSEGLIAELHSALNEIRDDKSVRAVVIAANGPAFSAGHDMKELTARRSDPDRGRGIGLARKSRFINGHDARNGRFDGRGPRSGLRRHHRRL